MAVKEVECDSRMGFHVGSWVVEISQIGNGNCWDVVVENRRRNLDSMADQILNETPKFLARLRT